MTNSELITRALRRIGVLSEVETASAEQSTQGIQMLNDLMADWEQEGVSLGYYEQTSLTDDTPIPDHARAAVIYYLSFALAPEYGKQVSAEMYGAGQKSYDRLIREAVLQNMRESTLEKLPAGESSYQTGNLL